MKPCARSNPNFNDCAVEHAKETFPQFVKGECRTVQPEHTKILLNVKQGTVVSIVVLLLGCYKTLLRYENNPINLVCRAKCFNC